MTFKEHGSEGLPEEPKGAQIHVVVPFRLPGAKSRLASVLGPEERHGLALCMLEDVVEAVSGLGQVTLLIRRGAKGRDAIPPGPFKVLDCDLDLNDSLNQFLEFWQRQGWPGDVLIVMADLALMTRDDLDMLIRTDGDVVLSPGRGGGTNLVLIRSPAFRTCYQGYSFLNHRDLARSLGLKLGVYASYRTSCDVDEPQDLAEILIHGEGRSRRFLEDLGFSLSREAGRARVHREAGRARSHGVQKTGRKGNDADHVWLLEEA